MPSELIDQLNVAINNFFDEEEGRTKKSKINTPRHMISIYVFLKSIPAYGNEDNFTDLTKAYMKFREDLIQNYLAKQSKLYITTTSEILIDIANILEAEKKTKLPSNIKELSLQIFREKTPFIKFYFQTSAMMSTLDSSIYKKTDLINFQNIVLALKTLLNVTDKHFEDLLTVPGNLLERPSLVATPKERDAQFKHNSPLLTKAKVSFMKLSNQLSVNEAKLVLQKIEPSLIDPWLDIACNRFFYRAQIISVLTEFYKTEVATIFYSDIHMLMKISISANQIDQQKMANYRKRAFQSASMIESYNLLDELTANDHGRKLFYHFIMVEYRYSKKIGTEFSQIFKSMFSTTQDPKEKMFLAWLQDPNTMPDFNNLFRNLEWAFNTIKSTAEDYERFRNMATSLKTLSYPQRLPSELVTIYKLQLVKTFLLNHVDEKSFDIDDLTATIRVLAKADLFPDCSKLYKSEHLISYLRYWHSIFSYYKTQYLSEQGYNELPLIEKIVKNLAKDHEFKDLTFDDQVFFVSFSDRVKRSVAVAESKQLDALHDEQSKLPQIDQTLAGITCPKLIFSNTLNKSLIPILTLTFVCKNPSNRSTLSSNLKDCKALLEAAQNEQLSDLSRYLKLVFELCDTIFYYEKPKYEGHKFDNFADNQQVLTAINSCIYGLNILRSKKDWSTTIKYLSVPLSMLCIIFISEFNAHIEPELYSSWVEDFPEISSQKNQISLRHALEFIMSIRSPNRDTSLNPEKTLFKLHRTISELSKSQYQNTWLSSLKDEPLIFPVELPALNLYIQLILQLIDLNFLSNKLAKDLVRANCFPNTKNQLTTPELLSSVDKNLAKLKSDFLFETSEKPPIIGFYKKIIQFSLENNLYSNLISAMKHPELIMNSTEEENKFIEEYIRTSNTKEKKTAAPTTPAGKHPDVTRNLTMPSELINQLDTALKNFLLNAEASLYTLFSKAGTHVLSTYIFLKSIPTDFDKDNLTALTTAYTNFRNNLVKTHEDLIKNSGSTTKTTSLLLEDLATLLANNKTIGLPKDFQQLSSEIFSSKIPFIEFYFQISAMLSSFDGEDTDRRKDYENFKKIVLALKAILNITDQRPEDLPKNLLLPPPFVETAEAKFHHNSPLITKAQVSCMKLSNQISANEAKLEGDLTSSKIDPWLDIACNRFINREQIPSILPQLHKVEVATLFYSDIYQLMRILTSTDKELTQKMPKYRKQAFHTLSMIENYNLLDVLTADIQSRKLFYRFIMIENRYSIEMGTEFSKIFESMISTTQDPTEKAFLAWLQNPNTKDSFDKPYHKLEEAFQVITDENSTVKDYERFRDMAKLGTLSFPRGITKELITIYQLHLVNIFLLKHVKYRHYDVRDLGETIYYLATTNIFPNCEIIYKSGNLISFLRYWHSIFSYYKAHYVSKREYNELALIEHTVKSLANHGIKALTTEDQIFLESIRKNDPIALIQKRGEAESKQLAEFLSQAAALPNMVQKSTNPKEDLFIQFGMHIVTILNWSFTVDKNSTHRTLLSKHLQFVKTVLEAAPIEQCSDPSSYLKFVFELCERIFNLENRKYEHRNQAKLLDFELDNPEDNQQIMHTRACISKLNTLRSRPDWQKLKAHLSIQLCMMAIIFISEFNGNPVPDDYSSWLDDLPDTTSKENEIPIRHLLEYLMSLRFPNRHATANSTNILLRLHKAISELSTSNYKNKWLSSLKSSPLIFPKELPALNLYIQQALQLIDLNSLDHPIAKDLEAANCFPKTKDKKLEKLLSIENHLAQLKSNFLFEINAKLPIVGYYRKIIEFSLQCFSPSSNSTSANQPQLILNLLDIIRTHKDLFSLSDRHKLIIIYLDILLGFARSQKKNLDELISTRVLEFFRENYKELIKDKTYIDVDEYKMGLFFKQVENIFWDVNVTNLPNFEETVFLVSHVYMAGRTIMAPYWLELLGKNNKVPYKDKCNNLASICKILNLLPKNDLVGMDGPQILEIFLSAKANISKILSININNVDIPTEFRKYLAQLFMSKQVFLKFCARISHLSKENEDFKAVILKLADILVIKEDYKNQFKAIIEATPTKEFMRDPYSSPTELEKEAKFEDYPLLTLAQKSFTTLSEEFSSEESKLSDKLPKQVAIEPQLAIAAQRFSMRETLEKDSPKLRKPELAALLIFDVTGLMNVFTRQEALVAESKEESKKERASSALAQVHKTLTQIKQYPDLNLLLLKDKGRNAFYRLILIKIMAHDESVFELIKDMATHSTNPLEAKFLESFCKFESLNTKPDGLLPILYTYYQLCHACIFLKAQCGSDKSQTSEELLNIIKSHFPNWNDKLTSHKDFFKYLFKQLKFFKKHYGFLCADSKPSIGIFLNFEEELKFIQELNKRDFDAEVKKKKEADVIVTEKIKPCSTDTQTPVVAPPSTSAKPVKTPAGTINQTAKPSAATTHTVAPTAPAARVPAPAAPTRPAARPPVARPSVVTTTPTPIARPPVVRTTPTPAARPPVVTTPAPAARPPVVTTTPIPARPPVVTIAPAPATRPPVVTTPAPAARPPVVTTPVPATRPPVVTTTPTPAVISPVVTNTPNPAPRPVAVPTNSAPRPAAEVKQVIRAVNPPVTDEEHKHLMVPCSTTTILTALTSKSKHYNLTPLFSKPILQTAVPIALLNLTEIIYKFNEQFAVVIFGSYNINLFLEYDLFASIDLIILCDDPTTLDIQSFIKFLQESKVAHNPVYDPIFGIIILKIFHKDDLLTINLSFVKKQQDKTIEQCMCDIVNRATFNVQTVFTTISKSNSLELHVPEKHHKSIQRREISFTNEDKKCNCLTDFLEIVRYKMRFKGFEENGVIKNFMQAAGNLQQLFINQYNDPRFTMEYKLKQYKYFFLELFSFENYTQTIQELNYFWAIHALIDLGREEIAPTIPLLYQCTGKPYDKVKYFCLYLLALAFINGKNPVVFEQIARYCLASSDNENDQQLIDLIETWVRGNSVLFEDRALSALIESLHNYYNKKRTAPLAQQYHQMMLMPPVQHPHAAMVPYLPFQPNYP